MSSVNWYTEDDDGPFYGWWAGRDPRTTDHDFVVKQVPRTNEPDSDLVWGGWVIDPDRMSSQCVTHDHVAAAAAQQELEEVVVMNP